LTSGESGPISRAHDDRFRTRKAPPPPCHPGTGERLVVPVPQDWLRGTL